MIPDADYILEAEQKGVPPFEPDWTEVLSDLNAADGRIDSVTEVLLHAEDMMLETDYADDIRNLIRQVDALQVEVWKTIKKIKGGF